MGERAGRRAPVVWAWLIGWPWWARCLVIAAQLALGVGTVWYLAMPDVAAAMGWAWGLGLLTCVSLVAAGLVVGSQDPVVGAYRKVLDGLDRSQRAAVARALRRGEMPADPRVMTAAIGVGTLALAYRTRSAARTRMLQWLAVALWVAAGCLSLIGGDVRQGVLWFVLAAILAAATAWRRLRAAQGRRNLELLRAAATTSPADEAASGGPALPAPLPRQRVALAAAAAVILICAAASVIYVWGRPDPDCRPADAAITFIAEHPDMLDPRAVTAASELTVAQYMSWSSQLDDDASQASSPDIAAHLRRIAQLSGRLAALVRDTRQNVPTGGDVAVQELAFRHDAEELIAAEYALLEICHPR